jgi:hypothetical protein
VAALYTAADIAFDPATHSSVLPDGRVVPHVTGILRAVGISHNFDEAGDLRDAAALRAPWGHDYLAYRRALGIAVHADCHAYDDGDLLESDVRVQPYVEAWAEFRARTGLAPLAGGRERYVYHPVYVYAGILDAILCDAHDTARLILADLKIGDPDQAGCHLQTAAYEAAWMTAHPQCPITERWAVRLLPDETPPYAIVNYTQRRLGWQDFRKFQACLTVYHEQAARREPIR